MKKIIPFLFIFILLNLFIGIFLSLFFEISFSPGMILILWLMDTGGSDIFYLFKQFFIFEFIIFIISLLFTIVFLKAHARYKSVMDKNKERNDDV